MFVISAEAAWRVQTSYTFRTVRLVYKSLLSIENVRLFTTTGKDMEDTSTAERRKCDFVTHSQIAFNTHTDLQLTAANTLEHTDTRRVTNVHRM